MNIGILGGTFNPVHVGHLILAEEIREKLALDKVIFVPTFIPPHKKENKDIAKATDRLTMVKLAIKGNQYFSVSDVEIKRKGQSYTIDTLRVFKKKYPKDNLFFITGSDLLNYLSEWKDVDQIMKIVKFVVATRPGYSLDKIPTNIKKVDIRAIDVSAFEVRDCIKKKKSFRYLVPEQVFLYIKRKRLYK